MFRELVDLARRLEQEGKLPPPGFYGYREPIKWTVHLWPDQVYLEKADVPLPRPSSGRTSGREEHLLTDEAGYALGVSRTADGGEDRWASDKHRRFRTLLHAFLASPTLADRSLREAIGWLLLALEDGSVANQERFEEITSKEWVSFVAGRGELAGSHLFQHPAAKEYWLQEMQRRSASGEKAKQATVIGSCSVCGRIGRPLVRKIPLSVKLVGATPLHSLNADAFTSFVGGANTADKAHLGCCFECGDSAARAFNHLSNSSRHRRDLYRNLKSRDSLANMIALYWLKAPAPILVGEEQIEVDLSELDGLINLGLPLNRAAQAPSAALSQLDGLLRAPWVPSEATLRLDDYGFYLAILSPNVGRIAVRDWIAVSLQALKSTLAAFMQAVRMVSPLGDSVRPISIGAIIDAMGDAGADLRRSLLRCAYTGSLPPSALVALAGRRLGTLFVSEAPLRDRQRGRGREQTRVWDDSWPQALAAAIKLVLFYGKEDIEHMETVNHLHRSRAYQCGRLLAVLEEAQQLHHYHRYRDRLDTTIVNRSYGGASSAPKSTFAQLLRLAAMSHLPDAGGWINIQVEEIVTTLVELGGMPDTLPLSEQAEFGLGFYQQRAEIRARRPSGKSREDAPEADAPEKDDTPNTDVEEGV